MTARRTGIVSVAALAAMTLTVGVVHAVAPDWARRMGFDVWNVGEAEAAVRDAAVAGDKIQRTGDNVGRQIGASDHVTNALVAGQLTLAEAVEELSLVNAGRPGLLTGLQRINPSATDDRELMATYAITKVCTALADDPSRRAAAMSRLTREYRELTGKAWVPAD